jgi:TRAP-type C4-dicarboxylate transport system permease large subunit
MTARIDAVTALFAGPFVAGLLLLLIFAVAWVARAERLRRERSNRFLAPWVRADRTPGELR